jgi:hypothetical protein
VSPEIIAAIVGPVAVGIISYLSTKLSAHKGANKVREVVEKQFEEKIGQPNGLGSVVSMLEMTIREGRERSELLVEKGKELSEQLVQHMAADVAHFDRLESAIKEQHPSDQLDRMEQSIKDNHPPAQ